MSMRKLAQVMDMKEPELREVLRALAAKLEGSGLSLVQSETEATLAVAKEVSPAIEAAIRARIRERNRRCGTRSPRYTSYEMRDFLARNHVPYQWIDIEITANDPETKNLLEALGPEAANLPVVLFPDGSKLLEGVPAQVAQKVGLRTRAQTNFYDLAIIGGGPAGLAAAVYGASEGLHTVIVERRPPAVRRE